MGGSKRTTGAWSLTRNMTHHWMMWMLSSIIQNNSEVSRCCISAFSHAKCHRYKLHATFPNTYLP